MQHLCWRQFILMKPGKSEGKKKKGRMLGITFQKSGLCMEL